MLQVITDKKPHLNHLQGAEAALRGGAKWIQLRMKKSSVEEVAAVAKEILKLCREYGATFIIDDYVEVTKSVGADGVHLGRNDMNPLEAREILGSESIIGGTANTLEDVLRLNELGVDYIGLGPFRYTTTKSNLSPLLGLDGVREVISEARQRGVAIPIVVIGGVVVEDINSIIGAGATGVALSGVILSADNPVEQTRRILEELVKWTNVPTQIE